ncbi:MAG: hypothetical protein GX774_08115 [Armatimonadetes bacterium]|nr:hypothetical protein [Armatimonadota bacterium]
MPKLFRSCLLSGRLAGAVLALALLSLGPQPARSGAAPLLSLIDGGSFEADAAAWSLAPGARVEPAADAPHGRRALCITSGQAMQDVLDLKPGATYTIAASYRAQEVRPTGAKGYAYIAVYQLDPFGDISAYHDFVQFTGTCDWQRASYTFEVEPDARTISIRAGLFQAEGTLWLDAFTLVEGAQPAAFASVTEQEAVVAAIPGLTPSPKGNVAILRDDFPLQASPISGESAPADPELLAQVLRQAGFGVAFLSADQLADRRMLTRETFDVLVLPYGPVFPVKAADNFRRFLRRGGKFISTGGYAFDHLLEKRDGQWQKPAPPPAPPVEDARWHYQFPADELRGKGTLTFTGQLRTLNIAGEGFAFFAVYQYAADGSLVTFHDICQIRGSTDWSAHRYEFDVHEKAAVVDLHAGLFRCRGVAWIDDITLTDATGQVLLRSGFEEEWPVDARQPRNWWRSVAENCLLDRQGGREGGAALKVRLSYFYFSPAGERLNTRHGRPGDGLEVAPTQLGVFQPDFRLERAVALRPAPESAGVWGQERVREWTRRGRASRATPLEGYAAIGAIGSSARWLPLLDAQDRYGRSRGPAGGLIRHYGGTYARSSWAYFGVTNQDLFAADAFPGPAGLVALVTDLVRDTYLARVLPEPACVRPGEEATLKATVFNGGRQERRVRVAFSFFAEGKRRAAHTAVVTTEAAPGQSTEAAVRWQPPADGSDYYRVVCRLSEGGRTIDELESGLVVWNPAVVARGPRLSLRDNYLHFGETPRFLFGTDDWGYVFFEDRETPAQWRFDAAQRRDFGVQIYENLQLGMPATPEAREAFFRKCDGVVQLAQKYGQVYFAGLLIGANVAASDEELARQTAWCAEFARRYRDVPGLIYYPNGDLRCRIDDAVTPQWNQFLKERYGSDEALRAAWGEFAPKEPLGQIPVVEYHGNAWDDVRAYDMNLFRGWLIRRWNSALIRAIRAEDPDALTSCEFYQLPHEGVDVPEGIGELDLSNIGYFDRPLDDIRRFPSVLKYSDQRARGKSLGPGEYGVKTHPAWGDGADYGYHITRTPEQAMDLFLAVPHYALGVGASRIHNWCWKDCSHRVFPWGMVYPGNGVAKEILRAHRAQSLLFRQFEPVYHEPEVYVVTADAHRLGGQKFRVIEGILRGIHLATAAHVENLGVLNERNLAAGAEIPASAKVLFYPLPYCPSDAACQKLLAWVRAGGTLYLSGDISYDENRQRTRTARLEELCGVRFIGERYPNIAYGDAAPVALAGRDGWNFAPGHPGLHLEPAGAQVIATAADGAPAAVLHTVGAGRVVFLAEPMELHSTAETLATDVGVYRKVLALAGVQPLAITPDDPLLHVFRVPLKDGGSVYVLFNADESKPEREVTLAIRPPQPGGLGEPPSGLTCVLSKQRPGLVWIDGAGRLRAVEAGRRVSSGDQVLLECLGQTILFSADGQDLRESRAVVVLPLAAGSAQVAAGGVSGTPAAEVGEVCEGRWRRYEGLPVRLSGGLAALRVPGEAAGSILLVGSARHLPAARKQVQTLMTQ